MLGLDQSTWVDFETGDTHSERRVETHVYTQESQTVWTEYNETTMSYDAGYEHAIQSVSDYLWYSLDAWGRTNSNSTLPQCGDTGDCLGQDFDVQKCCAAISMTSEEDTNSYMYRCLDKGLIGAYMEFSLIGQMSVVVTCDSGAAYLAAGLAAAAATFATVY